MEIVVIVLSAFNFLLLIFLLLRFRWNKYEESVLKRIRKEVKELITELNRVTDRNITIIEDSIYKKKELEQKIKENINKKEKQKHKNKQTKIGINLPNKDKSSKKVNEKNIINDKLKKSTEAKDDNGFDPIIKSIYQKTSHNVYSNINKKKIMD